MRLEIIHFLILFLLMEMVKKENHPQAANPLYNEMKIMRLRFTIIYGMD